MGLQLAPAYIGDPTYDHPVLLDRNMVLATFGRTGLLKYGDLAVTPVSGAMQANIGPGAAVLVGRENSLQGAYFAWSNAAENVAWPTASGSPRIDSLLLRVQDQAYGVIGGAQGASWEVVQGVPGSSPVAVSETDFDSGGSHYQPGAWFRLGNWRVDPGDTQLNPANWTINQKYVRGSIRDSLCLSTDRPTNPAFGDRILEINTGLSRRWSGSSWTVIGEALGAAKPADTARIVSVIAPDPDLSIPVVANATYLVKMEVTWNAHASGDIQWNFSAPSGSVMSQYRMICTALTGPAIEAAIIPTLGTVQARAATTGQDCLLQISGTLFTGSTPGAFAWAWAQNTAFGIGTTIYKGSFLELIRVG